MTNGTLLLYILAFPKVDEKLYRPVQLHPAIHEGKHLMLQHPNKTYAILGVCLSIGNTMVHQEKELLQLEEDGGISPFRRVVTLLVPTRKITDNLLKQSTKDRCSDHFNGTLEAASVKHRLVGTFVVQYDDEAVTVGGRNYKSYSTSHQLQMTAGFLWSTYMT
ncbi:uncharacterized protein LOC120284949 isoform X4 [Drosophila simulans]|uniref:uncharacterized protein LOC120284949 isoform X4 n=1 Tax=Drosophila simulans TaxID=7240 RepID=UPI00192D14A2|nr:uncharacterized protein LOC120284949 isoform X4 [Drosophila simulans]